MNHQWYEEALIYHMYTLSMADGPGLAGIESWIPHIKGMGFNAVLLSPIFKSRSHGYDVTDYYEIDRRLGTNADFQFLVKTFHENNMRVILDSVFNHCGRDFFAFRELLNDNRGYASWFSGVDFNNRSPLGDPFTYNTWGGHYELPKFNLQNDMVKKYLIDVAHFWIDTFDIDGMRLDAADVLDFDFMNELRRVTAEKKLDFWLMGEVVHGDYSKWVNPKTLHSVTNYKLHKSLISSHNDNNLYELAFSAQNAVPAQGLPLQTFLDNHDVSRVASVVSNPEYLNTLYTLLFTLPGIPSVYYGSEWRFEAKKEAGSDSNLRPYINIEKHWDYDTFLTGHISRMLHIRQKEKALKFGQYKQIFWEYKRPFAFERSFENERIIVAVNIIDRNEVINLSGCCGGNGLFDLLADERIADTSAIQMRPHSSRILKEKKF